MNRRTFLARLISVPVAAVVAPRIAIPPSSVVFDVAPGITVTEACSVDFEWSSLDAAGASEALARWEEKWADFFDSVIEDEVYRS